VLRDLSANLALTGKARIIVVGKFDMSYALTPPSQVHGSYRLDDLSVLVARYGISRWFIPSIWPETFSFATQEILATGLPVCSFDLGAQGDAVRAAVARGSPGGIIALHDGQASSDTILATLLSGIN